MKIPNCVWLEEQFSSCVAADDRQRLHEDLLETLTVYSESWLWQDTMLRSQITSVEFCISGNIDTMASETNHAGPYALKMFALNLEVTEYQFKMQLKTYEGQQPEKKNNKTNGVYMLKPYWVGKMNHEESILSENLFFIFILF